jgi:hypothetical protein
MGEGKGGGVCYRISKLVAHSHHRSSCTPSFILPRVKQRGRRQINYRPYHSSALYTGRFLEYTELFAQYTADFANAGIGSDRVYYSRHQAAVASSGFAQA